ncbi:MAG: Type I restriction-modification system [Candidatus Alkanophagales archaeon MCA70_species_2]|nr:Type I restriction-modification system [Candidatus Alkanophaga liquidiphilum]
MKNTYRKEVNLKTLSMQWSNCVCAFDIRVLQKVIVNINKILNKSLPPLWDQLYEKYRYELDLSVAELIEIKNPEKNIESLYQTLIDRAC